MTNAVSGTTQGALTLNQTAVGGSGGAGWTGANGGNASSVLAVNDTSASALTANVTAIGGAGGNGCCDTFSPLGGAGGNANAAVNARGIGSVTAAAVATGGNAGFTYIDPVYDPTPFARAGTATADASASAVGNNNASALATATGGSGSGSIINGAANATANATAAGSGIAAALATGNGSGGGAATASSTSTAASGTDDPCIGVRAGRRNRKRHDADDDRRFGGDVFPASTQVKAFRPSARPRASTLTAWGVMGAGYSGTGAPVTYNQSADFKFSSAGNLLALNFTGAASLGNGFNQATFNVFSNNSLVYTQGFSSALAAQAFFSGGFLWLPMIEGASDIQISFSETMSAPGGFGFSYSLAESSAVAATPLPAALPLFVTGLGAIGMLGLRRKRKASVALVAATTH